MIMFRPTIILQPIKQVFEKFTKVKFVEVEIAPANQPPKKKDNPDDKSKES